MQLIFITIPLFQKRLEEIAMAWDNLLHVSGDKRQKLFDSQKREDFVREADEVSAWITDKVAVASSEEAGKDLEHVELLLKKFDEFFKVIVNWFIIQWNLCNHAQGTLKYGN